VILANQVLEVAIVGKQLGLVRVDKRIAYLDIDDTGLVEARCSPETKLSDSITRCDGVTEERVMCERRAPTT
jgi:hypothetical protein